MNIEKIHKLFLSSKLLLFTIVFVFVGLRLYTNGDQLGNLSFWASLVIQLGIAFFLLQLNHIFNIIQEHTFLPALFYLLFTGSNPIFYYDWRGSIAALCLILSCYFLFKSYQKPESQINAMNISLLLVLGGLLWNPLLLFIPVFWIGFHHLQCFSVRVFFASLTGFVIVYLFIFTWSIFQGDENIFFSLLPRLDPFLSIQIPDLSILEWIISGFVLFICLIIGTYLFFFNISERVWTITVLTYLYFSSFIIFAYFLLLSEYKSSWGLVGYVPVAFLTGHFFSRMNKKSVHYLLLVFILFFIGIGVVQYISS